MASIFAPSSFILMTSASLNDSSMAVMGCPVRAAEAERAARGAH